MVSTLIFRRWNLDEVRNGDAFRYHFRTDMPTKPVLQPWNTTEFAYEPKNKTLPEDVGDLEGALGGQAEHNSPRVQVMKSTYNRQKSSDNDPGVHRVQLVEALVLKEEYRSLHHKPG